MPGSDESVGAKPLRSCRSSSVHTCRPRQPHLTHRKGLLPVKNLMTLSRTRERALTI